MDVIWLYLIGLGLFIYLYRKKIQFQFPLFILKNEKLAEQVYKTFKHIDLNILWDIGTFTAIVGMPIVLWLLVDNAWKLFAIPSAPAGVSIIIPGVQIPGSPIFLPFVQGIIAIAVLAAVHEFAHALAAANNGIKPKSMALALMLFIPAAGVELDDKKVDKLPLRKRLRIFAAGTFANFVTALLFLGLLLAVGSYTTQFVHQEGITISAIDSDGPAVGILEAGMVVTGVNGEPTESLQAFQTEMQKYKSGDSVTFTTDKGERTVTLSSFEDGRARIGIRSTPKISLDPPAQPLLWILDLFKWLFILNFGVGLMNLLPLPFVDGGRIFGDLTKAIVPKFSKNVIGAVYALALLTLLINLGVPIARAVL